MTLINSPVIDMIAPLPSQPLIERMERALLLLAYLIEIDGDVHLPMYEKFEAELEELKARENTRGRARRRLLAYEGNAPISICRASS